MRFGIDGGTERDAAIFETQRSSVDVLACRRPTPVSGRLLGGLACVLACVAAALSAPPALAAEGCPNEQLRQESSTNPTTGQPYSASLPECRAYEMVSPLYKQAHAARPLTEGGFPAASDGDTVGFGSEGDFSSPENYRVNGVPSNSYLAQRSASGWITSSVFAPRSLVDYPFLQGLEVDSSPDLRSVRVSCGVSTSGKGEAGGAVQSVVCALRKTDGSWVPTPTYTGVKGLAAVASSTAYVGGSSDLSRVFIQPSLPLLGSDNLPTTGDAGIYEISGVGTASANLRLVNVDNEGNELVLLAEEGQVQAPLFGDRRHSTQVGGSAYHAVSADGQTVFFTATPAGSETQTVYARTHCAAGPPSCKDDGNNEWLETVTVSNVTPSGCGACTASEPKLAAESATFAGASADGSKVFFTTKQHLLSTDSTRNLYEYDFNKPEGHKLVLLSADPSGASVQGVLRSSPDGSHVYFVAAGVLPNAAANMSGQSAQPGKQNLYVYDTVTEGLKFIATAAIGGLEEEPGVSTDTQRHAQTTPDGRYLVFSSLTRLAGNLNTSGAQAVYRYDFETGELTWVSHGASGFKVENEGEAKYEGEGKSASVAALLGSYVGGQASVDDWNRAISENGETIIFSTGERLQADDTNRARDVYVWHAGTVAMISDGHDSEGVGPETGSEATAVMSASGSDIFFVTPTRLAGQDTDVLGDLYDARVDGGFPAPAAEPSCPPESAGGCQGRESPAPVFGPQSSSLFSAAGNLTPASSQTLAIVVRKPKPVTRAQQLARALKACRGKPKKKRALCESQARKRYGGKAKAKKKVKAKKSDRETK